jgi:protein tyrosine/serine phosphatase
MRTIQGSSPVIRRAWAAALVLPLVLGTALAATPGAATPADSLGPLRMAGIGLENFGVVDGRIYRGAQPGKDDYRALAALGVTTVIDLRLDAKSSSRGYAEAAGLKYLNIGIDGQGQPTDGDVVAFLKALDENPTAKVYVHCAGGRHRTGSMIAVYRMVRDGWTLERAYQEMLAYDFYTRFGHEGFKSFVDGYWQRMNANPSSVPVAAVQASK